MNSPAVPNNTPPTSPPVTPAPHEYPDWCYDYAVQLMGQAESN